MSLAEAGTSVKADFGLLRGTPGQTSQRLYWHNKATGLLADIPGEAMLEPSQWGTLKWTEKTADDLEHDPEPILRE